MRKSKRILLRDVAEAAGVSTAAMSKALRDLPDISPETRERLKKLAADMGYRPDPALSALAAYKKRNYVHQFNSTLGFVSTEDTQTKLLKNTMQQGRFELLETQAQRLGYKIQPIAIGLDKKKHRQIGRTLFHQGIRGLILPPSPLSLNDYGLRWADFAAVTLFRHPTQPFFHAVTVNQQHVMQQVAGQIHAQGYHRPAVLIPEITYRQTGSSWLDAFSFAHQQREGGSLIPPHILIDGKEHKIVPWIKKYKIDVIIGVGRGVLIDSVSKNGLSVPKHIGFVVTDIDESDRRSSGLTRSREQLFRLAIDVLNGMLQRGETGKQKLPFSIQIEAQWQPGKTLSAKNAS
ncbi:MAG: LacI family DNA-binding transcriptional regulator [Verrucomicrobiota bacterium]